MNDHTPRCETCKYLPRHGRHPGACGIIAGMKYLPALLALTACQGPGHTCEPSNVRLNGPNLHFEVQSYEARTNTITIMVEPREGFELVEIE